MASQPFDMELMLDSEQSEAPESSILGLTQSSSSLPSRKRPRTSKIWDHAPATNSVLVNKAGASVWRCKYCLKEYYETAGTKNPVKHLREAHKIDVSSIQAIKALSRQVNINDAFQRSGDYARRCLSTAQTQTLDPATLEILYIRWITACGVAFRMVSREEFRSFLQYLNPEIENWLPTSATTIQLWTVRTYESEKLQIQQKVQSALSKVHFTVDLWTSPNSLAIIGIIGHYIAENGDLQHSVLALQELDGKHSG